MLTLGCRRGAADMAVDDSGEDEGDDDDDASDEEDQDEWDPTNATPAKQRWALTPDSDCKTLHQPNASARISFFLSEPCVGEGSMIPFS